MVNLEDSGLDLELADWLKMELVINPQRVIVNYLWAISSAVHKHSIEIPFPQRDLHLKSGKLVMLRPV